MENLSYRKPLLQGHNLSSGLRTFCGQGSALVSSQVRWESATRAGLMTTTRVGFNDHDKSRVSDRNKSGVSDLDKSGFSDRNKSGVSDRDKSG